MVTASQNSTMLARQDRFPACPPETPGLENRDKRSGRLRHDEAISRISDLAPGKLGYGMTGEQRALYRRELNAYSDCRAPLGEVSGEEEFVVPEAAVGHLHHMLR